MKRLKLMAALISLAAFTACTTNSNYRNLTSTGWTLDEIVYADSTYTISPPAEVTINFSDSSRITGFAGCNSFFGIYSTEGNDQINIEVRGSTLAYCPFMDFEERYHALLNLTDLYSAERDELRLEDTQNRVTLVFRPTLSLP